MKWKNNNTINSTREVYVMYDGYREFEYKHLHRLGTSSQGKPSAYWKWFVLVVLEFGSVL